MLCPHSTVCYMYILTRTVCYILTVARRLWAFFGDESDFEGKGVYGYMPEADHDLLLAMTSDGMDDSGAASSALPSDLFPGQ